MSSKKGEPGSPKRKVIVAVPDYELDPNVSYCPEEMENACPLRDGCQRKLFPSLSWRYCDKLRGYQTPLKGRRIKEEE